MNLDKCMEEVAEKISSFLLSEGGYDNGYYTYVEGAVNADEKGILKWSTPKAKDELTEKGFNVRGTELYKAIQGIMHENKVDKLVIRCRDREYGAYETVVVYVTETKTRVDFFSRPKVIDATE
jgi:hypothetical protein